MLIVLFIFRKKRFEKQRSYNSIVKRENTYIQKNRNRNFLGPNLRKTFRVVVNENHCSVRFLELENSRLQKLKGKRFDGYLENISIGGLKLICDYDLPVKQNIFIEISFRLKDEKFCLKGEILRKEVHNHKDMFVYGIKFVDISDEKQELLNKVLNQIIFEKK